LIHAPTVHASYNTHLQHHPTRHGKLHDATRTVSHRCPDLNLPSNNWARWSSGEA
jgi:hypothetical protein